MAIQERDESATERAGRRTRAATRAHRRMGLLLPALFGLLVAAVLANAGSGAVRIPPLQVIAIVAERAGLSLDVAVSPQQDAVLWNIRLPRITLAALVGASLALAGAVLQGVFRNPLADPSLIGVSSGAALGAVAAIVLGVSSLGLATLPLAAFVGGMLAMLLVYGFARSGGRTEVVTLILAGIAINAVAGAITGLFIFVANDVQLRTIVFWTLGSLGGATWRGVLSVTPFIVLGLVLLPRWGRQLNLLALGEREARHLGVDTERLRFLIVLLAALVTGASVAVAGIIGFVGLVVPHIIRLVAGPDHRFLLPASAVAGAVILLFADLAARTLVLPRELPLGVVTALAGGPFFLWLLHRTRKEHGGWG